MQTHVNNLQISYTTQNPRNVFITGQKPCSELYSACGNQGRGPVQGPSVNRVVPEVSHCSQEGGSGFIHHIFHVIEFLEKIDATIVTYVTQ